MSEKMWYVDHVSRRLKSPVITERHCEKYYSKSCDVETWFGIVEVRAFHYPYWKTSIFRFTAEGKTYSRRYERALSDKTLIRFAYKFSKEVTQLIEEAQDD